MSRGVSLAFPPFTRTVKTLIGINVAIYFLTLLLAISHQDAGVSAIYGTLSLIPREVVHGHIWQLVTYSFIHGGFFHIFFNMLTLWMFGSSLEQHWGRRQFTEFYFFCVLGAALVTVLLSYAGGQVLHLYPTTPTLGASGGIYGLLLAFGWLFGEQEIYMFPLPFRIKAKYMVAVLILIALAGALGDPSGSGIANIAHLGGLFFGYAYLKFLPRRGFAFAFSEGFYGMRNSYHRWQRRCAAGNIQVYMRKHNSDPKQYFDEYGNFRPPDDIDKDKKDGGKGGWVN